MLILSLITGLYDVNVDMRNGFVGKENRKSKRQLIELGSIIRILLNELALPTSKVTYISQIGNHNFRDIKSYKSNLHIYLKFKYYNFSQLPLCAYLFEFHIDNTMVMLCRFLTKGRNSNFFKIDFLVNSN